MKVVANPKRKRVAVCFSGQPRLAGYATLTFLKNIIAPFAEQGYEVNSFVHFWTSMEQSGWLKNRVAYTPGSTNLTPEAHTKYVKAIANSYPAEISPEIVDKFQTDFVNFMESCSPIYYQLEEELTRENFVLEKFIHPQPRSAIAYNSQYYSVMKSHELCRRFEKENNFRYDYVMRIRPDTIFLDPIPIEQIDPNQICVPSSNGHGGTYTEEEVAGMRDDPQQFSILTKSAAACDTSLQQYEQSLTTIHYFDPTHTCNDQFAISSSENMFKYSRFLEYMHDSLEDSESVLCKEMNTPLGINLERMLFLHIQEFSSIKTLEMRNRLHAPSIPIDGKVQNIADKLLEKMK